MKNPEHPSRLSRADSASPDAETGQAALAWVVGQGKGDDVFQHVAVQVRRNRQRRVRLAATGALALLALGFFWQVRNPAWSEARTIAKSLPAVVSQPERRVLPDGSIVELNRDARITVDFRAGETGVRRVVLETGEAHFQVAKNPQRPFVVVAAGVAVRAVGTAFSVQLGTQAVEVLVTEGRVSVDQPAEASTLATPIATPAADAPVAFATPVAPAFVDAGHRVLVDLTAVPTSSAAPAPLPVVAMSATQMSARLAWRVPMLEFAGTPLSEVIPMFNQHGPMRLVLGDRAMGELQVSGMLRADNTAALLRLLQTEFGLVAEPRGDATVLRRP